MKLYRDTVQDRYGNVIAGAEVTVKKQSDGTGAALYDALTGAPIASNTVKTDANGEFAFKIGNGEYKIEIRTPELALTREGVAIGGAWIVRGAWSGATTYLPDDVVTYNGASYVAIAQSTSQAPPNATYWQSVAAQGPTGPTGPGGPTGPTGPKAVNWQGAWSGATAYAADDAVSYSGSSYVCILGHTNQQPPNATYWGLLAQKGQDGAGTGDVVGPASAVDSRVAVFSGTTGKLIGDSGSLLSDFLAKSGGTMTGAYKEATASLTFAATIAVNADLGNQFGVVLTGNATMGTPTGTFADGQRLSIYVQQDSTGGRILTFPAGTYRFDTPPYADPAPTVSTANDTSFYYNFVRNVSWNRWDYIARLNTVNNYVLGKQTVWLPADAFSPRTGATQPGCAALATTNGASNQPDRPYLAFDDTVDEYARAEITMPKAWNGGAIEFECLFGAASATTGNMVWGIRALNVYADIAWTLSSVFGTAGTATQVVPSATDKMNSTGYGLNFTPAGSTSGRGLLLLECFRKPSDTVNDTAVGDGYLYGVLLHYTVNASNDN